MSWITANKFIKSILTRSTNGYFIYLTIFTFLIKQMIGNNSEIREISMVNLPLQCSWHKYSWTTSTDGQTWKTERESVWERGTGLKRERQRFWELCWQGNWGHCYCVSANVYNTKCTIRITQNINYKYQCVSGNKKTLFLRTSVKTSWAF